LRDLDFFLDELSILSIRLEEVASANNGQSVMAKVEHFQNKFIMLREQLDILRHDVNHRNEVVTEISKDKPEHTNEKSNEVSGKLQSRVKDFSNSIADTRYEFNRFLANVL
jgi:hypothetical protein